MSQQILNSSYHSNTANTSAADIFISLKNQSLDDDDDDDDNLLDSSYTNGVSSKENNPNSVNSKHRNLHAHMGRSLNSSIDSWQSGNRMPPHQETHKLNNEVMDLDPHGAIGARGFDERPRHQVQREVICNGVGSVRDNLYEETFQDAFSTDGQNEGLS